MATTKKKIVEGADNPMKRSVDPTQQAQAASKADVDAQDSRTRLWQSLNQSYTAQKENIANEYAKAYSQADRQALSRGMGRSSYNNQTLANINEQKIKALSNADSAMIADYQNRIGEIEAQEKEEEWKQKQFDESVRQFDESQALQREQAELSRQFQTSEREAQQAYSTAEREAQQGWQAEQTRLQQEWQAAQTRLEQAWKSGEEEKAREAQRQLQELSQQFQAEQSALSREQSQSQFETQLEYQKSRDEIEDAFKQEQWKTQVAQWEKEFDYTSKSDAQKIAFQTVMTTLEKGGTPTEALLEKAGLTMEDYKAMKGESGSSGAGSSGGFVPGYAQKGFDSMEDMRKAEAAGMTAEQWYAAHPRAGQQQGGSTRAEAIETLNQQITKTNTELSLAYERLRNAPNESIKQGIQKEIDRLKAQLSGLKSELGKLQ